jgi:hypothetical protein
MPMPAPVQDNVFPFGHEELHVMEYGHPNQPIIKEIKKNTCLQV